MEEKNTVLIQLNNQWVEIVGCVFSEGDDGSFRLQIPETFLSQFPAMICFNKITHPICFKINGRVSTQAWFTNRESGWFLAQGKF